MAAKSFTRASAASGPSEIEPAVAEPQQTTRETGDLGFVRHQYHGNTAAR